ncbi:hypothetical protein D3C76_664110 [compost metagenome]
MRLDLRLKHPHFCLVFTALLHMHSVEQTIDFIHQIIEALGQQGHFVAAFLFHACSEVPILYPAHEADNHSNAACNPVHKKQVEDHCTKEAQEDHDYEPAGKHRHFTGQRIPRSNRDQTPGIVLEMIDRKYAFLAVELGFEALESFLKGEILRRKRMEILAVQLAVRIE